VNAPQGSYVRIGAATTFSIVSAPGPAFTADPEGNPTPGVSPTTDPQFTNARAFRVAGFQSGPIKPDASTGIGAQFGAIVIPHDAIVRVIGGVASSVPGSPITELIGSNFQIFRSRPSWRCWLWEG
jgi:hypothetical protein